MASMIEGASTGHDCQAAKGVVFFGYDIPSPALVMNGNQNAVTANVDPAAGAGFLLGNARLY